MVPRNTPAQRSMVRLRRHVLAMLYPALAVLPAQDWDAALRKARSAEFDTVEWTGVIGGVGLVAWLLQLDWPPGASALAVFVLQFPLALVLLGAIVGPFYLRRTRRGLEREIHQRHRRPGLG